MHTTRNKQIKKPLTSAPRKRCSSRTTGKFIKYVLLVYILIIMVAIKISRTAFYELMYQLSSKPAERGGILLGPTGTNYITHFYFDRSGVCTGGTYSPDYTTLNRRMRQQWRPSGLELKGFVHSHAGNLDQLTAGDMSYIKKLLSKNPHMNMFIAPIVVPNQHRIQPYIISRDSMNYAQRAHFEFF